MGGGDCDIKGKAASASLGDRDFKGKAASASLGDGDLKGKAASASLEGDNLPRNPSSAKLRMLRLLGMKSTAEEALPNGSGKKKKKMKVVKTRVTQEFVDHMIANPCTPIREIPEEKLANRSPEFRQGFAERKGLADMVLAYQQGLIKQYMERGYFEEEAEITDEEED